MRIAAFFLIAYLPGLVVSGQAAPPVLQTINRLVTGGFADGYTTWNANRPVSAQNQLRAFDVRSGLPQFNMAGVTLERQSRPWGFRVDLTAGHGYGLVHASDDLRGPTRHFMQAFLTYRPRWARSLQLDAGKFAANAGYEGVESHRNWNYSRSLLHYYLTPNYHLGLRAVVSLSDTMSAGAYVVTGWNMLRDNNSGKTWGLMMTAGRDRLSWTANYIRGPEEPGRADAVRSLLDTNVQFRPHERTAAYVNCDYLLEHLSGYGSGEYSAVGVAAGVRHILSSRVAVSSRGEWLNDSHGFTTGARQRLKEATFTAELSLSKYLKSRLEWRQDWSSAQVFDHRRGIASARSQPTLILAIIAYFERTRGNDAR